MHPCTWRPAGRALPALLLAALGAAAGCVGGADSQTINGRVDRTSFGAQVIGARVVAGDEVIATTPVASDGTFRLDIPAGAGYRLEILAADGVHPYRAADVGGVAHFDVCAPSAPWDLGMVTEHGCTDPDVPPPEPGCDGGGHPPWCPPGVPDEECNDPCQWDPEACGDPCALYPEDCDPCAMNPELCQDPCEQFPELCEDPCGPEGCEDPCAIDPALCDPCLQDPTLCMCPDGTPNCDPCLEDPSLCEDPCALDPSLCDPCAEHPELCDPCLADPSLCDPCQTRPELCECPDPGPDGTCDDPCAEHPELCDPCLLHPEMCDPCLEYPWLCEDPCALDPAMCDPCLADPTLCDPGCTDPSGNCDTPCMDPSDPNCWPPDEPTCDADGTCDDEPQQCAAAEQPIPDFGCPGGP